MTDVQSIPEVELTEAEQTGFCCANSTRRRILLGAGAVGATAVLAACGTSTTSTNDTGSDFSGTPAPAGSKGADAIGGGGATATAGSGSGSGDSSASGPALTTTSKVPVGGGVVTTDYVITQPTAGTYKAFSNVCPHAGCKVDKVDSGVISCPCHGSQFSVKDGSVTTGPATTGLTAKNVKVSGDNIVAA